jgi:hypothetical protein
MGGGATAQESQRLQKTACLLGTALSVLSILGTGLGFALAHWLGISVLFGAACGGLMGLFLACGTFCGAFSKLNLKGNRSDSTASLMSGDDAGGSAVRPDVEATFPAETQLGISFTVKRSKRDGERWLVVAAAPRSGGQGAQVPGIEPGMAVKSAQGGALDLDNLESVLAERPLRIVFGDIDSPAAALDMSPASAPPEPESGSRRGKKGGHGKTGAVLAGIAVADSDSGEPTQVQPEPEPEPEPETGPQPESEGKKKSRFFKHKNRPDDVEMSGDDPSEMEGHSEPEPEPEPELMSGDEKLRAVFLKFDEDGDSFLSRTETNNYLDKVGEPQLQTKAWKKLIKTTASSSQGLSLETFSSSVGVNAEEEYEKLFAAGESRFEPLLLPDAASTTADDSAVEV